MALYLRGHRYPVAGAGLALAKLAMPDLDLIKQVEQECVTGRPAGRLPLGLLLREDDELVRPQDFLTTSFRCEEEGAIL